MPITANIMFNINKKQIVIRIESNKFVIEIDSNDEKIHFSLAVN